MPADEIPSDVWTAISSHLILPRHHIVLSHICQASRAVYTSEEKWKQLCRSMGIGRPSAECEKKWKDVFWEVIRHRSRCRVPQCFQYGAPAVLEHIQYFKDIAPPCSCGHCSSDEEDEWTDSDGAEDDDEIEDDDEEDDDDEGDSNSEDDDGEEAEDVPDWDEYANMNPLDLFPGAPNALMAAALQESMMAFMAPMGIHPPPLPRPNDKSKSKSKTSKSKDPKIRSKLLPLSWQNRKAVPVSPKLHPFLAQTGSVQFQRFLSGGMALQPRTEGPLVVPKGINWSDAVDTRGAKRNLDLTVVRMHPILHRAFATNPPVTSLHFDIDNYAEGFSLEANNPEGVTVSDVVWGLSKYFIASMSDEEKSEHCATYPHPKCFLDRFRSRLGYLLRDHPAPPQVDGIKNDIRECWYRGLVRLEKGEVHIELSPVHKDTWE